MYFDIFKKHTIPNGCILESRKVFDKFLNVSNKLDLVLIEPEFRSYIESNFISNKIVEISRDEMSKIKGYKYIQGIAATTTYLKYSSIEEIEGNCLILNGITSPENIGSILRSAAAFGINNIIYDKKTCDPYVKRCIRVSLGNIFNCKIFPVDTLDEALILLKEKEYLTIASANNPESEELKSLKPNLGKTAVIIGSEGHGIDKNILDLADRVVKIPINSNVAHLNAAVAASIFSYHLSQSV